MKTYILMIALMLFGCNVQAQEKSYTQYFDEINGYWQPPWKNSATMQIHLDDIDNYVMEGKMKYFVDLADIDRDNHIVKLKVTGYIDGYDPDSKVESIKDMIYYYFRQMYSDDGQSFYLTCFKERNDKQSQIFKMSFLKK